METKKNNDNTSINSQPLPNNNILPSTENDIILNNDNKILNTNEKENNNSNIKVNLSDSFNLKATDITLLEKGLTFLQIFVSYILSNCYFRRF